MGIPIRTLPATLAISLVLAGCASTPTPESSAGEAAAGVATAVAPDAGDSAAEAAADATLSPMERWVTPYVVKQGEDMLDIARAQDLGFLELKAANPGVDSWLPKAGQEIVLPNHHIPAVTMDHGLLINLAQMRIFRFDNDAVVETHPLGIGREGLETPLGRTSVVRKAKDPVWRPTARMREEDPTLPAVVPAGPQNPLGNRALYLDWPLYRIHGTNIPWGVGRRVSSGCIRMYPEDVEPFYDMVDVGTPVEVVDQRFLAAWRDDKLWVEVHPTADGWDALEQGGALPRDTLGTEMVRVLTEAAPETARIDWQAVYRAVRERRGYPVVVGGPAEAPSS